MDDSTVDYKEMYLDMVRASERAVRALEAGQPERARRLLIDAQRRCEERYIGP